MEFERNGHSGKINPDGTIEAKTNFGVSVVTNKDGTMDVEMGSIRSVAIDNVLDLESYAINEIAGSKSHVIKFSNGGSANFAYNNAGQLIEFGCRKVQVSISHDGKVTLRLPDSAAKAGPIA